MKKDKVPKTITAIAVVNKKNPKFNVRDIYRFREGFELELENDEEIVVVEIVFKGKK